MLLLFLALSVAFAGCATPDTTDDGDDGTTAVPSETSPEQARSLLEQAGSGAPDRLAAEMTLLKGSATLMSVKGTFDNSTGTSYLDIRGDPEALGAAMSDGEEGAEQMAGLLAQGFSIYSTPAGSLYYANGTAFTFPPANESGDDMGFVPDPSDNPFNEFLTPGGLVSNFTDEDMTIKSVTPTTHRGKGALKIELSFPMDNETIEPTVYLFTSPPRIARIEGVNPLDSDNPTDPFAGASVSIDFFYDAEITTKVPEDVTRALALAYDSDKEIFSFGEPKPETWTFLVDGGVALADAEIQIKDTSSMGEEESGMSDVTALGQLPTKWSMKLSEGTMTQDGVTLTFTDVDGDAKVSKGDTLRIEFEGEDAPTAVLKDLKTGVYVVPGPALLLLLAGVGAAALVLRRR